MLDVRPTNRVHRIFLPMIAETQLSPQTIGGIAGAIGVIVSLILVKRRGQKLAEGTKMGMNFSSDLKCPKCDAGLPTTRTPKNFRQMMWGGWTCPGCGTELDKWLKPIEPKK